MKSIDFPGAYLKIGEGQDQYNTVHAMPIDGNEGQIFAIYRLSDEEVERIVKSKTLYYSRLTFHNQAECRHCNKITPTGFQPFLITTEPPKINVKLVYDEGQVTEVEAEIREGGVHIPGYIKTMEGKYVKADQ